jgi:hypothetical protein
MVAVMVLIVVFIAMVIAIIVSMLMAPVPISGLVVFVQPVVFAIFPAIV